MEPARKFKIIVNSKECGTCSGSSPSAVAKKVVKKLCGTSSKMVRFSLKECKRGCERECGPYQGRMEKLDKPYTRAGKKITHRVVCGKARKMRGGRDLVDADFDRDETTDTFHPINIDRKPHVFFGGKYNEPFKFVVFNKERIKLLGKKSVGIDVLEGTDVKHVDLNDLSLELQYELSRLRKNLENKTEYRTIRDFLKNYSIFKSITEQTFENVPEKYVDYSTKYEIRYNQNARLVKYIDYSILFFDFIQSKPRYCLVFTKNDFIVISINDGDIISIEDLFGEFYDYSIIYLLANNNDVPEFIKKKLNELIEKEKEIIKKIRDYFKKFDLKNIKSQTDILINILKTDFPDIPEKVFQRIINQEHVFINKQINKSINAHNKNNNKNIEAVYGTGINNNEKNNYDRFLKEGKRLANEQKNKILKQEKQRENKERENKERAKRNEESQEEKRKLKEKLNKYSNIVRKLKQIELFTLMGPELNNLIKNSIDISHINNDDLELIKTYVQKIRDLKEITNEYLNKNPKIIRDISNSTHNNRQQLLYNIFEDFKKKYDLSSYELDDIYYSILMRVSAKNTELKKIFIKPFAKDYILRHPELTESDIEQLSNNNINKLFSNQRSNQLKERLRYGDKKYIRYQLKKAKSNYQKPKNNRNGNNGNGNNNNE